MKTIMYVPLITMLLAQGLRAQDQAYLKWVERREALKKDPSVARYYTFENVNDSGSIIPDLSGNGGNLQFAPYTDKITKKVYDDLKVVEGRWKDKKAVRLDLGAYQGPGYNIEKEQFTAEVWFRRIGPGSEPLSIVNRRRGHLLSLEGHRRGWRIITAYDSPVSGNTFSAASVITFQLGKNESEKASPAVSARTMLTDNIWQHLAVSWDGNEMRLYLNGKLLGSTPYDKEYIPVERKNSFRLGFAGLGMGAVVTDIDEVVIYNRVLTAEEIEKLSKGVAGVSREEALARGDDFLARGDYGNARKEYSKLEMLPDYGRELALFNIAECYRLEKDFVNVHRIFGEISDIPDLKPYYRIHAMFKQAEAYIEQKDYKNAVQLYGMIPETKGATDYHVFTSRLKTGDAFRDQRMHSEARKVYLGLLKNEESSSFPNDGNRLELCDRLEAIDGLNDGTAEKSMSAKLEEWINSPGQSIYVSPQGKDNNTGAKDKPFATVKRAQEEARKLKEKGGVVVYLREGSYFISEPLTFSKEDSGTENFPIVYRSFPGEEARIIGGAQIKNFSLLSDASILRRLPEESHGKVWVADLKEAGITDYGKMFNRIDESNPAPMELICNGKIMQLSRWPNDSWLRVAGLTKPGGDYKFRNVPYEKGKFVYGGDRPERWKGEKDIWLMGYMGVETPFLRKRLGVESIDTDKKIMYVREDPYQRKKDPHYTGNRVAAKHPYFAYNLLSEIDMPGEWYLDRETGRLYFYPPDELKESQVSATMVHKPLAQFKDASNIVFFGLTIEGGRSHAFEITGGRNNIIAGSIIRNTGQYAVRITGGWEHKVIGCDIYDTGSGGVFLEGGDREKLIPSKHLLENNHIYRFAGRFNAGYAVWVDGIGQRVSHNVINDGPLQALYFNANDHIIEFNELHDTPHEGREIGAVYVYGSPWALMNRGTVIRNNFFHHISTHSSPNYTHGLNAIHIDAVNAGIVLKDNIFYRFPNGISSTQPGNYITNNVFIDSSSSAIGQGDRSSIYCEGGDINAGPNLFLVRRLADLLNSMRYKQPPWSFRYPPLVGMIEKEPAIWGKIQGSIIERNVNTGGRFISFGEGTLATTRFNDNWDGNDPLFMDREKMDFSFRPGSHVYGLTGCGEIETKKAGVYQDKLRASWPINRSKEDIGRYYKPGKSSIGDVKMSLSSLPRIYPPLEYNIPIRKTPIVVDGKPGETEWPGMEQKNVLAIDRKDAKDKKGIKSFARLLYDKDYLYIATKHEPDPYIEGMSESQKNHFPAFELAIETQSGSHSRGWWMEDMTTGPIYIIWGYFSGKHQVMNPFKMPFSNLKSLEDSIEYKVSVINEETREWTSEMKIPLASIGINPSEIDKLCFNMGVWKRDDWVAWVPTGGSVWRIENAGFIRFVK